MDKSLYDSIQRELASGTPIEVLVLKFGSQVYSILNTHVANNTPTPNVSVRRSGGFSSASAVPGPKGDKGDKGDQGDKGDPGADGTGGGGAPGGDDGQVLAKASNTDYDVEWVTITTPMCPTFILALGEAITVGANKTNILIAPVDCIIQKVFAVAKTGPTGADLIFDINLNGSTIWSTQSNRLKIVAGGTTGNTTTFNTTAIAAGDQLTIDVDQVGSTIAGQDVTVSLLVLVTR